MEENGNKKVFQQNCQNKMSKHNNINIIVYYIKIGIIGQRHLIFYKNIIIWYIIKKPLL